MPGVDWAYSFLKRNSSQLNKSHCQNINSVRAGIGVNQINEYFDNLSKSLNYVPPENTFNFDETNLSDDPGSIKCVFPIKVKYP